MKPQLNRRFSSFFVAIATVTALSSSALAQTTYTYTPNGTITNTWTANSPANWNAVPLSGATNTLTFAGTTAAGGGLTDTTTNNNSGTFLVGTINLNGTGSTAGAASVLTITGGTLGLSSGGTINLNAAAGTKGLSYALNSAITLEGNANIAGTGTAAFNIGGAIGDGGGGFGITKTGSSTVTLSGTNTYSGATALNGGTVIISAAAGLGNSGASNTISFNGGTLESLSGTYSLGTTRSITMTGAGTINTAAGTLTVNGNISGAGALTVAGAGTTSFSGTNSSFSGTTTLANGILILNSSTALGTTPSIKFTGGTLEYSSSNTTDYSSIITGSTSAVSINTGGQNISFANGLTGNSGGLSVSDTGSGSLTLNATAGYTGNIALNSGTLILGTTPGLAALSAGTITFAGGTLNTNGATGTLSNVLSGANGTIAAGSGALTFGGAWSLNSGTQGLTINNSSTFNGNVALSTATTGRNLTLAGSGAVVLNGIISSNAGAASGLQGLTYTGTGTVTLTNANTYTGVTLLNSSTTTGSIQLGNGTAGHDGTINNSSTITDTKGTFDFDIAGNQTLSVGITGAGLVVMNGPGTQTLTGTNTYTGTTTISSGTLEFGNVASLYSGVPASATSTNTIVKNGGTIAFGVGGTGQFTTGNVTTLLGNLDGSVTTGGLLSGSAIAFDTTSASGNNFTVTNAINNTTGTGGGAVGLTKLGTNTLTLSGTSNYTGPTTVANGTLSVSNLTSGANLGSGTSAVVLGTSSTSGDLSYSGTTANGTYTNGVTVNAGGGEVDTTTSGQTLTIATGNVTGTGGFTVGGAGNTTISSNLTHSGSFTSNSTGTVTLSGTGNSYTGATTINSGTVILASGANLAGTAVAVSGGTLQVGALNTSGTNTIGSSGNGSLTLNSGAISIGNGALNILDVNGTSGTTGLTTAGGGTLNFTIGGTGSNSEGVSEIVLGSGMLASLTGSTNVYLTVVGTLTGSQQTLISWASGSSVGTNNFSLAGITGTPGYTLTLTETSTGLVLNEAGSTNLYWKGGSGSSPASWATAANFTTDSAGNNPNSSPLTNTSPTNTAVTFVASGAGNDTPTTLDGSYTINNLTFNTLGVAIAPGSGSGNVLTLTSSGVALTVATGLGSGNDTISAKVALGASQTWAVGGTAAGDSSETLTDSGVISDGGSGYGLTKSGNGTLILSATHAAPNTYKGATQINAGIVSIQGAGALGTSATGTSGITVAGTGAALQLKGSFGSSGNTALPATSLSLSGTGVSSNGALENVSGNNFYSGAITLAAAASIGSDANTLSLQTGGVNTNGNTLTLVGAGNGYIYSSITGGGGVTMSGSGMWTLDGSNSYSGTTTITNGTLQLGPDSGPYGSTTNALSLSGGTFDLNGQVMNVSTLSGTAGTISNSNTAGSSSDAQLYINNATTASYAGSIANGSAPVDLIMQGSGTQTLTGNNTYSGPTTVSSGALNIGSSTALSPNTAVTVSGGALQLSGGGTSTPSTATLGLSGTGVGNAGALENYSGNNTFNGAITLNSSASIGADTGTLLTLSSTATVGGSGNNLTLVGAGNGAINSVIGTGSGGLTMNGTGTWTLSGLNTYTGATAVTNGTLVYTSAPVLANSSIINLGSATTGTATLTYSGAGETIANPLNFNTVTSGTQTVVLSNSGTGAVNYNSSTATTFGNGTRTIVLGSATDTYGGSIGGLANATTGTTSLTKTGTVNDLWNLTGTNTYTGPTTINGGVLQIASASALPSGNLNMNGTASNAVLQTSGTLNLNTGSAAGQVQWGNNSGFSAYGGSLTITLNAGAQLTFGSGSFGTIGGVPIVFGSSTSNAQVILTNNINLNSANDTYQENFFVAKGAGGDSALLSGVLSNGTGVSAAVGFNKVGGGTLIVNNANNSYSGYTSVTGGTLIAEGSSATTPSQSATGIFGNGDGPSTAPSAAFSTIYLGTGNGGGASVEGGVINPTLLIGGNYTIANPINVAWSAANAIAGNTNATYGIGGYLDASSTFSGLVTLTGAAATGNTFAISQVATTGTDALNLTGGITATGAGTVNFTNVGAVNVNTNPIAGAGLAVIQSGAGTTTFAANNTYTGTTSVSGGKLRVTGLESAATGTTTVGGFTGGLSTATLSGTGTLGGALTTMPSGGNSANVAHLAPGVNTSGNFGSAGTLTVAGPLTIGAGTNLDIDLNTTNTVGGGVNDLIAMTGSGANGVLTIGGSVTVNINALGTLALNSDYTLISGAASSSGLTAGNFSAVLSGAGAAGDAANFLVSGNNLEVYFTAPAIQSFTTPTPVPLRIITGTTATVGATLQNTALSGANALNVSLTDNSSGGHGSVTAFSGSNPTTIAANSSSTVNGTFTAGSAGTGTWGITNTDGSASPTTANTGGSVTVYTKSAPSLSPTSVSFGAVHQNATGVAVTSSLLNGSGTYVAGLQVTSLASGLSGTTVGNVIAQGGSASLTAAVNTSTVGSTPQTYAIGTSDDQTISGWSANSTTTLTATGQVYSGAGVWIGTGTGGTYGTPSLTQTNWQANGGVPGLAGSPFNTTDSATFGNTSTAQTVTLDGQSPYLNTITFNNTSTGSYNLGEGTGSGLIHLNSTGTAYITDTAGNNTISAPVELDSNTTVSVARTADTLTISGVISDPGQSLTYSGPGTTVVTAANTYMGGTTVNGGTTYVNNTTGSGTGTGAVQVNSGGTLGGSGKISGAVTVNTTTTTATLASGSLQTSYAYGNTPGGAVVNGTGTGGGLTLNSTLSVNGGSTLAFALGSNVDSSGGFSLANPNTDSTYMTVAGSGDIFSNTTSTDNVLLTDLTYGAPVGGVTLTLRYAGAYELITAASGDFSNLYTTGAGHTGAGYVLGVDNGTGGYSPFNIEMLNPNGTQINTGTNYQNLELYLNVGLNGGDVLEVVPEPGTWALMLGGLALLIVIQRRRNKLS